MQKKLLALLSTVILSFVKPIPLIAQSYNMTSGNLTTCSGTFYDSGGPASNYPNNCNLTETFTSTGSNCLTFTFISFLTQGGNDILTIYDGPDISSPVIGNFSGFASPGTVISSTSSLTFVFVSNGSNNKFGWSATISCVGCGTTFLLNSNSTINSCDGLFYDSGGLTGNYGNNENYVQTFCSGNSSCIEFNFYSMSIASGDTLKIYDGPDISSTLIGAYTSTMIAPPPLLSSTGCLTFSMRTNNGGTSAGWMAAISCQPCPSPPGPNATYKMPTLQLGGSFLGGPMVATCSGTFTDWGGLSNPYPNNQPEIYQTFCPGALNNCLRLQFYSIHIKSDDRLQVLNGPAMDVYPFNAASNNISGNCTGYAACMANGWGPYVSSDQSGCISFIFQSGASPNDSGWVATFDCVPCAGGPNGIDNNDCGLVTSLCTNTSFSDASTGPGVSGDVDDDCLITETYSNWYTFHVMSTGTLGFTIDPLSTGGGQPDDYDWALYGPNVNCSSLGNPIRCSSATTQGQSNNFGNMGNTGISTANNQIWPGYSCFSYSDVTESSCGNCWVNDLPVTAGQTYYLCISKWSAGGSGFNLDWNLSSGASIDCPVLAVELTSFECATQTNLITLNWTSASEINNDYYIVEKSFDGEHYDVLTTTPGKEYSVFPTQYFMIDNHPFTGNNYYRLKQVDKNGIEKVLGTTACTFFDPTEEVTMKIFDLSGKLIFTTNTTTADFQSLLHILPLGDGVYVIALIHDNGAADLIKFLKVN